MGGDFVPCPYIVPVCILLQKISDLLLLEADQQTKLADSTEYWTWIAKNCGSSEAKSYFWSLQIRRKLQFIRGKKSKTFFFGLLINFVEKAS